MNFGQAIEAVKNGKLAARKGWKGKGMFIFMRPEAELSSEMIVNKVQSLPQAFKEWVADNYGDAPSDTIKFTPYLCMKAADNTVVNGWLASQTDMLAEDWELVDPGMKIEKPKNEEAPKTDAVKDNTAETATEMLKKWVGEKEEDRGFILIKEEKVDEDEEGRDLSVVCAVIGPNGMLIQSVNNAMNAKDCPLKQIVSKSSLLNFLETLINK